MPNPPCSFRPPLLIQGQEAFSGVLGNTPRIVLASLIAYLLKSLINAQIFAFWKSYVQGPKWARVFVSNTISTAVDSIVFITFAFYGFFTGRALISCQYLVKMAVTIISLPLLELLSAGEKSEKPLPFRIA